jgi:hypothetical protein
VDPVNFGTPNNTFGLAMTFAVEGSQLVAGGTVNLPCGAFVSSGTGEVVTGVIASDGSFTAQTPVGSAPPLSTLSTLQIKGTVPAAGAASWAGSYTFTNANTFCPSTMSGPFTATRIADVTGTYSGSATLTPSTGSPSTPVTVSFALQQGALLSGTSQLDPELLTGTVQVKGSSCFSSGTVSSVPSGGVLGTEVVTTFTMDDGSSMNVLGDVENAQSAKISVHNMFATGGKCGLLSSGPFEIVRR